MSSPIKLRPSMDMRPTTHLPDSPRGWDPRASTSKGFILFPLLLVFASSALGSPVTLSPGKMGPNALPTSKVKEALIGDEARLGLAIENHYDPHGEYALNP